MVKRILLLMVIIVLTTFSTPSLALDSLDVNDYVTMKKNKSFTKDGNYYMNFDFKNVVNKHTNENCDMEFYAKLVNSSGKDVLTWKPKRYKMGEGGNYSFYGNYNGLPSGKYTFFLYAKVAYDHWNIYNKAEWYWKYTINHVNNSSISFKSYEKIIRDNGKKVHRFNIQCTNISGKYLTISIYDSSGSLVTEIDGPKRKTNDEVGWFEWDGYDTFVGNEQCPTGDYIVQIKYSGSNKIVEQTFRLNMM